MPAVCPGAASGSTEIRTQGQRRAWLRRFRVKKGLRFRPVVGSEARRIHPVQRAGDAGAARLGRAEGEVRLDEVRSVVHDPQAHAGRFGVRIREAAAVVDDLQRHRAAIRGQANDDVIGPAVPDGVGKASCVMRYTCVAAWLSGTDTAC